MYNVVFKKSAEKDLMKINSVYYNILTAHIRGLAENPRPIGYIKLSVSKNLYRIRVGVYRVIYSINDDVLVVEVIKIDHRRNAYR